MVVTQARNDYNKYIWFCTPEQAEGKINYETIQSMDLDLRNGMAYSGSFFLAVSYAGKWNRLYHRDAVFATSGFDSIGLL